MISYRAIQSFDHIISQTDHGYENISSPNTYPYVSRSDDDDSIDDPVKFFSSQRLLESSSYEIT